jgi:hypothetical protein
MVRAALLVSRPTWHDELFTFWTARLNLAGLVEALRHDSGPPLFYVLEIPFVRFAESIHWDLLIRVLPYGASLFLLLAIRASLPRDEGGSWTLALAACSPLLTVYAAEARAYSLLALFSLLLFLLLLRGRPGSLRFWSAAAVAAAALWTHYLAIFFVAGCAVWLVGRRRFASAGALLAGALAFLPWIPTLAAQPAAATAWMYEPLTSSTIAFLSMLGGAGRIPVPLGGPLPAALTALGVAIGIGLLVAVLLSARRDPECADAIGLVLLAMIPILAVSLLRPVAFPGRSEMVILPLWLWAAGRTAARLRAARWLVAASAAVALASSATVLFAPKTESSPPRVVSAVARVSRPGDTIIASGAFYLPARLAWDRRQLAANLAAFPADQADHPGWITLRSPLESDYENFARVLAQTPAGHRIFVLLPPVARNVRLDRLLAERGSLRVAVDAPDALVYVCTPR